MLGAEEQIKVGPKTSGDWVSGAMMLAEHRDLEGSLWQLGLKETLDHQDFFADLETLSRSAEYPNLFFEKGWLSNSINSIARRKVKFLFLTETYGETRTLKFFAPVTQERLGIIGPVFFRIWSNEYSPLGMPLVEKRDVERIVEELYLSFGQIKSGQARGLVINTVPKHNRFTKLLKECGVKKNCIHSFNDYERAGLSPVGPKGYFKVSLSSKHRQRLNAARKKLDALGDVTIACVSTLPEIEVQLLDFLYIEGRGWKGVRKTALISQDSTRQLALGVVRELAASGQCEIYSLSLDEQVIASTIFLNSNGHYVAWKTTYDEAYSRYSVGNLLVVEATDEIASREGFKLLDSVALGDNVTANRLWPDPLELESLSIGFGDRGGALAKRMALNLSVFMKTKRALRNLLRR
ncbi:MAG: GNAT family N-acetyltransferase [Pseudomonadota bacterium]